MKSFIAVVVILVIIVTFMLLPQNSGQSYYTAGAISTAYPLPTQSDITPTYFDYEGWVKTAYPAAPPAATYIPSPPPPFDWSPPYIEPTKFATPTKIIAIESANTVESTRSEKYQQQINPWKKLAHFSKRTLWIIR